MGQNTTQSSVTSLQSERELDRLRLKRERTLLYQAKMEGAPHRIYNPLLFHDGVSWIAKADFGKGPNLVGRGDCPFEALQDYDEQWLGIK